MRNTEWEVGQFAKRVSGKAQSAMPLGYIGEVTAVDQGDVDQPICIDDIFWPYIMDIERVDAPDAKAN